MHRSPMSIVKAAIKSSVKAKAIQEPKSESSVFSVNEKTTSIHDGNHSTSLLIQNNSGCVVYIGGNNVSVRNGIMLVPRASLSVDLQEGYSLFAKVSKGDKAELRVLHTRG